MTSRRQVHATLGIDDTLPGSPGSGSDSQSSTALSYPLCMPTHICPQAETEIDRS